jgi:hypothetical protein
MRSWERTLPGCWLLVSDFYAAYHHDQGVTRATAVQALYQEAVAFTSSDPAVRFAQQESSEQRLRRLGLPCAGLGWEDGEAEEGAEGVDAPTEVAAGHRVSLEDRPTVAGARAETEAVAAVPVQRKLGVRILRHLEELFVFVGQPEVPPTNNAAEWSLRHLVTHLVTARKITGGTRSAAGTAPRWHSLRFSAPGALKVSTLLSSAASSCFPFTSELLP